MPKAVFVEKTVEAPEGVTLELKNMAVKVNGPKGNLERDFTGEPVKLALSKNKINLSVAFPRKRELAMLGTIEAHIRNMIIGVTQGYTYRLTIVYSHFPITVDIKPKMVEIKNLYGQRNPKEHVGQTSANIQEVCKLRGKEHKDPRRFMDGIWLKEHGIGIE